MNVLNLFRKNSFTLVSALILLFFSCSQYEIDNRNQFDYSAFNEAKSLLSITSIDYNSFRQAASASTIERNKNILEMINSQLGTEIILPDLALGLSDYDHEDILDIAKEQNWMTQQEINLTESFMDDIIDKGIETAINNYETAILSLNLPSSEFQKHNFFINTIKLLDYNNPKIFIEQSNAPAARSWWRCSLATVALVAATAGLVGCATIAACALSIALFVAASLNFADNCGPYLE